MPENKLFTGKVGIHPHTNNLIFNLLLPSVLFILALCTAVVSGVNVSGNEYLTLFSIRQGIPYALGIIIILIAHALGHYIQARLHSVKVYPPYFIPALGVVGTLGAYMKIQWPISDRKTLIKIFATGPICGFLTSWIVLIIGLFFSEVINISSAHSPVILGDSIIVNITTFAIIGKLPAGTDVMLHPIAYAGWLGLFYNFCHLLPIGRFDGGRLVYALWGHRITQWVSFITVGALFLLGHFSLDCSTWFMVAILGIISTIGLRGQYPSERYEQSLPKSLLVILSIVVVIIIVSFTSLPLPTLIE